MAYLAAADLRDRVEALADDTKFPDEVLDEYVAEFEEIAERYKGVAYEPRTLTETFELTCWTGILVLAWRKVRSITTFTIEGSAVSNYEVDKNTGTLTGSFGPGTAVVTYQHGLDEPPPSLLRACRQYVRACALTDQSNLPRDVIAQSSDGILTRFSTPDFAAGRPTGYLEVDRLLNGLTNYRVPGIA